MKDYSGGSGPNKAKIVETLRYLGVMPDLKSTVPIGHIGTFYQKYGGCIGKAAVAYFKWQMKADTSQKSLFCSPAADYTLSKIGFKTDSKNGMCK